jgi:mannosylglycerate hydrolase
VLSTRIWIKQRNHNCENDLLKWVEPLTAWVNLLDTTEPISESSNTLPQHKYLTEQGSIIRFTRKLLMQCHPHDSICGTTIDQVANEMKDRFNQVDQLNQELINQGLQRLSDQIDTRYTNSSSLSTGQQNILSSLVVFNPNDLPQTGLINLKIKLEKQYSSFDIIDDLGNTILYDQRGIGPIELISMTIDKKALKQALGMINEGNVAGMVIKDIVIEQKDDQVIVQATLSEKGIVDIAKWRHNIAQLELLITDQNVADYTIHAYSDPELDLSFIASDVSGHGYRSYWIRGFIEPNLKTPEPIKLNPLVQGLMPVINDISQIPLFSKLVRIKKRGSTKLSRTIENEHYLVEAHTSEGTISITDKHTHQVFSGLHRLIDSADCGDLYNYCPPEHDSKIFARIKKVESDKNETYQTLTIYYVLKIPARISMNRKSRSRERVINDIICTIMLVPGVPRIDIHTEIDNRASDHRLRVHFPAPFNCTESMLDGHFEIVQRPIGIPHYDESWEEPPRPEVPQRQFTFVTNNQTSLTIANRGLPEVELINNEGGTVEIAITLLRCVGWLSRDDITTRKGHAGPMGIATPEAQMPGKYNFDYSIITGDKNIRNSIHHAFSFTSPLKVISTTAHSGILPTKCSFIENPNQDFIISAIKLGEDNSSLIVRGCNILSTPIDLKIKPWRAFKQVQLVSLDEKFIKSLPISPQGHVNLHIDGYKIATIRFCD